MERSLIEIAYDFISQQEGSSSLKKIWAYVVKTADLSPEQAAEKISKFYTNLMFDGRFVTLGDNQWDLRVRHEFDKVHIDMRDVYSDIDSRDDDDKEDNTEENEYNAVFEEKSEENSDENMIIDGNEIEKPEESSSDEEAN